MGFKIDFNEEKASTGFELVAEGKYEVTIINAEANEYQGNYSIGYTVEIRSDVDQKHQGAKVLYNSIYLTSSNPEYAENTERKLNAFLVACGYKGKSSLDLEVVVNEVIGKPVLAYVKHVPDKQDPDRLYPRVSFVAPSKVSPVSHPGNDPFSTGGGPIEVSDDDLPF